jgi:BirA family biotin operon repressor/biotin-[acetyl-CoA-carboxylase] ligase
MAELRNLLLMVHESEDTEILPKATPFNTELLEKTLQKSFFGVNIVYRDTIGSTNVYLKELAQQGAAEGTVVIADDQSAGLGRLGRKWYSRKYENLLFSVLFRPEVPARKLFVLTMIFALAAVEAVEEISGLKAMIKWPNDIYIGGKKVGGILSEVVVLKGLVQQVVLGMGLNVNWKPTAEERVMYPTSSLLSESGKRISRELLLGKFLKRLEKYYNRAQGPEGDISEFFNLWNEKSLILGKKVVIETGKERIEGKAASVDLDGALTLICPGGAKRKFLCGDVSVKLK